MTSLAKVTVVLNQTVNYFVVEHDVGTILLEFRPVLLGRCRCNLEPAQFRKLNGVASHRSELREKNARLIVMS